MERKGRLDAACSTCGRLQVPDVGLYGPNSDRAASAAAPLTDHLSETLDFNLVPDHSRRAVALVEIHLDRINSSLCIRTLQSELLTPRIRRCDALSLSITGGAYSTNHRVDTVTVAASIAESLEHHDASTLSHDKAIRALVEGCRMIRRQRADLTKLGVGRDTHGAVRTTGDTHVDITALK